MGKRPPESGPSAPQTAPRRRALAMRDRPHLRPPRGNHQGGRTLAGKHGSSPNPKSKVQFVAGKTPAEFAERAKNLKLQEIGATNISIATWSVSTPRQAWAKSLLRSRCPASPFPSLEIGS